MLLIPVKYAPLEASDIPAETLACLGASVAGLPPVVAGVFPLIELAEARWFVEPSRREPMEAARALFIVAHRRGALADVLAYEAGDTERLDKAASAWIADHPEVTAHLADIHRLMIAPLASGFGLLPREGGGEGGEWWFGSEWLGGMVAAGCRQGLGTAEEVMWEVPFALVGHAVAASAKQSGRKGVGRKEDRAALEAKMEEWTAAEKRGELLPWQLDHPEEYPPTEEQIAAKPEILQEYEQLLAEKAKNAGH